MDGEVGRPRSETAGERTIAVASGAVAIGTVPLVNEPPGFD